MEVWLIWLFFIVNWCLLMLGMVDMVELYPRNDCYSLQLENGPVESSLIYPLKAIESSLIYPLEILWNFEMVSFHSFLYVYQAGYLKMVFFFTKISWIQPTILVWYDGNVRNGRWWAVMSMNSGWWFGTFLIFHNSWDDDPIWLIFFRGVETTNQNYSELTATSLEMMDVSYKRNDYDPSFPVNWWITFLFL